MSMGRAGKRRPLDWRRLVARLMAEDGTPQGRDFQVNTEEEHTHEPRFAAEVERRSHRTNYVHSGL